MVKGGNRILNLNNSKNKSRYNKQHLVKVGLLLAVAVIFMVIFVSNNDYIIHSKEMKEKYELAEELVENSKYEQALDLLKDLRYGDSERFSTYINGLLLAEEGSYSEAMEVLSEVGGFRNREFACEYCKIMLESDDKSRAQIMDGLGFLETSFSLKNKLNYKDFRAIVNKTVRKTNSIIEKEFEEQLRQTIPYAGLEEKYISKTAAGPYSRRERHEGWTYYYWDIGDYIVLTVKVSDTIDYRPLGVARKLHNVVSDVKQDFLNAAWIQKKVYRAYRLSNMQYVYSYMRMPRFGPCYNGKKVTSSDIRNMLNGHRSNSSSQSYEYNDYGYYDDFEDFYNDHYDDFDSYQEAEEYFDCYY